MARKRKRIRLISLFKRKSNKDEQRQQEPLYNEIIITEHDTISLKSMVLSAKRQGDFYVADMAIVEVDGYITGTITASNGIVKGRVKGNVACTNELVIKSKAIIEGNIIAKEIIVEHGSIINGTLCVTEETGQTRITLVEKLDKVRSFMNNGYLPEVEEIDVVERITPPPVEPVKTSTEPRIKGQTAKKKAKRTDSQRPPLDEKTGGWW